MGSASLVDCLDTVLLPSVVAGVQAVAVALVLAVAVALAVAFVPESVPVVLAVVDRFISCRYKVRTV